MKKLLVVLAALVAVAVPVSMLGGVGAAKADSTHCTKGSGWDAPWVDNLASGIIFNDTGAINNCDQAFSVTVRAQYNATGNNWVAAPMVGGGTAVWNLPAQSCGSSSPATFAAGSSNTYQLELGVSCSDLGNDTSRAHHDGAGYINHSLVSFCAVNWRFHVDILSSTGGDLGNFNSVAFQHTC